MNDSKYNIRVNAQSTYLEEQSEPTANRYAFAYTITIANTGTVAAQLLSRHWLITDANGRVQEVHGDGVVGQQPLIEPGKAFQYTSGAVLETPLGSMSGSYQMKASDGEQFTAAIPIFRLAVPRVLN
ncbi:MAG: Co2+/Mg2+ efflux protein ApaG [Gammaproteobacteria bacterium]|nr:Co2+/Mg2+ efflux protein ApaG [Gammaproteobacteria bacterium]